MLLHSDASGQTLPDPWTRQTYFWCAYPYSVFLGKATDLYLFGSVLNFLMLRVPVQNHLVCANTFFPLWVDESRLSFLWIHHVGIYQENKMNHLWISTAKGRERSTVEKEPHTLDYAFFLFPTVDTMVLGYQTLLVQLPFSGMSCLYWYVLLWCFMKTPWNEWWGYCIMHESTVFWSPEAVCPSSTQSTFARVYWFNLKDRPWRS